jgi:hypothetical protein
MTEEPSIETLFRQAPMTAHTYMSEAIAKLDEHFGEGYAQAHSELVGAFMITCALDYQAGEIERLAHAIEGAAASLSDSIERLA